MNKKEETHCGFVAIIGRPNVGKSTLLNKILGTKVSITSRKPQTTRHRILGIKTTDNIQVIYIDTPGLHQKEPHQINRIMNKIALAALQEVNVILWMIEANQWHEEETWILHRLEKIKIPIILVINKIDQLKDRQTLLPFIEKITKKYEFVRIIPISAKQNIQLEQLENEILQYMPASPFYFPKEQITDRNEQFMVTEMVREKLMRYLGDEIPYALTVALEALVHEKDIVRLAVIIWVDKESQKGIVIGDKGSVLKKVGTEARIDLEKYFKQKVFLKIWVKEKSGWTDDERLLRDFGYE